MPIKDPAKRREYDRRYRENNPEKKRESGRKWQEANHEKTAEYARKWREANPEKAAEVNRKCREANPEAYRRSAQNSSLKQAGWTLEEKEAAVIRQDNRCAICNEVMDIPCADHEHTDPPKPRELLCNNCNAGLGFFYDSIGRMKSAIQYLEKHGTTL